MADVNANHQVYRAIVYIQYKTQSWHLHIANEIIHPKYQFVSALLYPHFGKKMTKISEGTYKGPTLLKRFHRWFSVVIPAMAFIENI